MINLISLPIEILLKICSNLLVDNKRSLISIIRINKLFNEIATEVLYNKVLLTSTKQLRSFASNEKIHRVEDFTIRFLDPNSNFGTEVEDEMYLLVVKVLERTFGIVRLELKFPHRILKLDFFKMIQLKDVKVFDWWILHEYETLLPNQLEPFLIPFQLESLTLFFPLVNSGFTGILSCISTLVKHSNTLTSLNLKNHSPSIISLQADLFIPIKDFTCASSLKHLTIDSSRILFLPFISKCINLISFKTNYENDIIHFINSLIQVIPNPLEELNIWTKLSFRQSYYKLILNLFKQEFKSLSKLKVLNLNYSNQLLLNKFPEGKEIKNICKIKGIEIKFLNSTI